MAKAAKKKAVVRPEHRCEECAHAVDMQNKALDGHLILCRCPHYKGGAFLHFLSDYACEHFKHIQQQ